MMPPPQIEHPARVLRNELLVLDAVRSVHRLPATSRMRSTMSGPENGVLGWRGRRNLVFACLSFSKSCLHYLSKRDRLRF